MRKSHIKKLDQHGNIEIPEEVIKQLGISENEEVEILIENDEIIIRKRA